MNIQKPQSKQLIPASAKKVFQGKLFEVWQWEQKLFDGKTKTFEKVKRPETVMVLPVTDAGKIVLTEQEQPGEGFFIGLIGGIVDLGESVLEAAKRELLEESGYRAQNFILWDAVQLINKIEWPVYTFIAKGLKKEQDMQLDGGERIKLKEVTFDEFLVLTHEDKFRDIEVALKIHKDENNQKQMDKMKRLFIS